jgi:inner membrane protein
MDPPTHGLLGAVIAQAAFGRRLGPRALAAGAMAAMLPDIDVIAIPASPMGEWLYHRGVTHGLAPELLAGTLLGLAAGRWDERRDPGRAGTRAAWTALFTVTLLSHSMLDSFTSYGTQLLAPFSDRRFAVDAIAIVDPFFSAALVAALLVALFRGAASRTAAGAAAAALAFGSAYLIDGLHLNREAEARAREELAAVGWQDAEVRAYPTLLQLPLRRLTARQGEAWRVGWLSLWRPRPIEWQAFEEPRDPRVDEARRTREGRILEWFAAGQTAAAVVATPIGPAVEIDDLRYGFPGRPRQGLWGLRVRFDEAGRAREPAERLQRELPEPRALLRRIWRDTFS